MVIGQFLLGRMIFGASINIFMPNHLTSVQEVTPWKNQEMGLLKVSVIFVL
jgi:hypothetical protein